MKEKLFCKFAQTEDDRLFLAKMEDLAMLCEKRKSVCFSAFLDEHQKQVLKQATSSFSGGSVLFYGGYENAQREVAAFLPDFLPGILSEEYPVQAVCFAAKRPQVELSHRDYLGTILSLGIRREKVGDLLVTGDDCIAFVDRAIAPLLTQQIQKIKNQGVTVSLWTGLVVPPEEKVERITGSVSSVRLDSVLSLCRRLSREKAKKIIEEGRVQVNFMPVLRSDHKLLEGDVLSVKGFGRSVLESIGNETRKGRIFITVKNLL